MTIKVTRVRHQVAWRNSLYYTERSVLLRKWKVDAAAACWTDDGEAALFAALPNGLTNNINIFDIYKYRLSDGQTTNSSNHSSDSWGMEWIPHSELSISLGTRLTMQWARIKTNFLRNQ